MTLNEASLENRLNTLSSSQGGIQSLSVFCLHYKNHHKRIAQIWLRCLQKAKVPHRLTLIYLANDIVQNAKRKNALSFIDDFKSILRETIPYLKDDKIKKTVERVFSIWQDRNIYDSKFTTELKNALNETGRTHRSKESTPTKTITTAQSSIVSTTPPLTTLAPAPITTTITATTPSTTTTTPPVAVKSVPQNTNDLIETVDKLTSIEKHVDKMRPNVEDTIDRLAHGALKSNDSDKSLEELKGYMILLRTEIDERNKLAKLLEDSMNSHKKLLKESEDQLIVYKSQLDYITKLRDDLRMSH